MKFNHALKELTILVTETVKSNAFSTFSIIGLFDEFYSGDSIITQFDRTEQEQIVKQVIAQTKELGEEYEFFRIKTNSDTVTIAASNTQDFDSVSLDECLCQLFFIFHDAMNND